MNPRKALLSDADIVYDFSSLEEHWKKLRSLGLLHLLLGSAGLALQYFSEAFSKEPSGLLLLAAGLLQVSAAVFFAGVGKPSGLSSGLASYTCSRLLCS